MKEFKNLKEAQEAFDAISTNHENLITENSDLKKENSGLKSENIDLKKENGGLKSENEKHKSDISELDEIIEDMRKTKVSSPGKRSFEFEGRTKIITAEKFNIRGTEYTADEILKDTQLQASLVRGGVGFIVDEEEEKAKEEASK